MWKKPNLFRENAASIKQSYHGAGMFSEGQIAKGFRGTGERKCKIHAVAEKNNKK